MTTTAITFQQTAPAPTPAPAPAPAPAPPPEEPIDGVDLTWGQAFRGLAGAVVVSGIETVGNTASSLVRLPGAVAHAYSALYQTEALGPVLKTTLGAALVPAAVAIPMLTALGSAGFGLVRGFGEGAQKGVSAAARQGMDDVKRFHQEVAGTALHEALDALAGYKLEPGQKPYEIRVADGVIGLGAGVTAAAIESVGVGAVTALNTPRGVIRAAEELWKSEASMPAKTVASLLIPAGAVLATPFGVVGGALHGLVEGTRLGYGEGFGPATSAALENVAEYSKLVDKVLERD